MSKYPGHRAASLFAPILAGATLPDRLWACVGAFAGIAVTGLICSFGSTHPGLPLIAAPIGASALLVFAVPSSPLAQPWSVVGGNTVSALIGIAVAHLVPWPALAIGLAVAGAILAMSLLRCLHPPGGAAALTAVIGGPAVTSAGFAFAFLPVALNSLLLVLLGLAFHRFSGHSYPHRPVPTVGHVLPATGSPAFHPEDIDLALADLGETFDVSREDLELLFQQVEFHAAERLKITA
jgi:CBS domain-containing membrane protein